MISCKPVATPLSSSSEKLSTHQGEPLNSDDITKFRSIVGVLQYLSHTRLDLSFAINKVCQFLHSPTMAHMTATKWILWHLKLTLSTGLKIQKSASTLLSAFSDAEWAGCLDDHKSSGGFAMFSSAPTLSHGVPSTRLWPMLQPN
jgi:hypothetical protein